MITLACTFTYAFKDAFGHSRDRGYFCVGIQLSDTKQPSMPISARIYGVTGFSYFGHDFRPGNHDLFVVKALRQGQPSGPDFHHSIFAHR